MDVGVTHELLLHRKRGTHSVEPRTESMAEAVRPQPSEPSGFRRIFNDAESPRTASGPCARVSTPRALSRLQNSPRTKGCFHGSREVLCDQRAKSTFRRARKEFLLSSHFSTSPPSYPPRSGQFSLSVMSDLYSCERHWPTFKFAPQGRSSDPLGAHLD